MSIEEFWEKKGVNEYMVREMYDVDEVVRLHGRCPNDEDYKIEREYYYLELQGEDSWERIPITKEDYESNKEDQCYRTELNYSDFEGDFWMDEFEGRLLEIVEASQRNSFIDEITEAYYKIEHEKTNRFLSGIIEGLEEAASTVDRILKFKKERHGILINEIQRFVLTTYRQSYIDCKNEIVDEFDYLPKPKNSNSKSKKRNWEPVFEMILNGDIIVEQKRLSVYCCSFKGVKFKNRSQLGNKIAEVLELKDDTIRPILTDTINSEGVKNIFVSRNKLKIDSLMKNKTDSMCSFFRGKYENLK